MKEDIQFISDLHLAWEKSEITQRFLTFLDKATATTKALYILGDLFDTWVGDDDFSPPSLRIRTALKKLTDSGTQVFLQQGNRDFLLGKRFCEDTGVVLVQDEIVIDLFGVPTLLMHGDLLCTDDIAYQTFRIKSRNPDWQQSVLSKPLFIRLLAARWYRLKSYFYKRKQNEAIMDVNQTTVIETMIRNNCLRLIHGHTHRPNQHDFEINGQSAQRFVLADWTKANGFVLNWNKNGFRVIVL